MSPRRAGVVGALGLALALAGTTGACGDDGPIAATDAAATDGGIDGGIDGGADARIDAAAPFTLTSPAFADHGTLPATHTCDGAGTSPPLAWTGAPATTSELALLMTTIAPDGVKWNWVLYHVPAATTALAEASTGVGTAGRTSDGPALAYAPPCSQGPGPKTYTFTLYALSGPPTLPSPASAVTGPVLTAAIADRTLATASVTVTYTRPAAAP